MGEGVYVRMPGNFVVARLMLHNLCETRKGPIPNQITSASTLIVQHLLHLDDCDVTP